MPSLIHRKVKGKIYRYLVESYRDNGKVRQRVLKYLGAAPTLPEEAPIGVVLFAGGGGVECGMIAGGIRPVLCVECDPKKPTLSKALAQNNHLNFKPYGGRVINQTVEQVALAGFSDFPYAPDYLHASPVCSNFSLANKGKESLEDIEAAIATAQAIRHLQPKYFTLENVPAYQNSDSWYLINQTLKEEGYLVKQEILDAADYGVPQSRRRFIVVASRFTQPKLPAKLQRVGWYEAIEDLIDELPASELLPSQQKGLELKRSLQPSIKALLIERTGFREGTPKVREPFEPCWTIKRSIFTDQNGNNRSRFIDVWLADGADGVVKGITIEAIARLQSFPSWYYLPDEVSLAGSILGYSVPPLLIKALLTSN
jgi:DNA (cytosine-5)-methyltransferase 1